MKRPIRCALLILQAFLLVTTGWAQAPAVSPPPVADRGQELTVGRLEARLAEVERDSSIPSDKKAAFKEKVENAIEILERRDADQAELAGYQTDLADANAMVDSLREQTRQAALPADPGALVTAGEHALEEEAFRALLAREEANLGTLRADREALAAMVSAETARPEQIAGERSEAERNLRESTAELQKLDSGATGEADRLLQQARREAASRAIRKLELEEQSHVQRLRLMQAKLDLAAARENRAAARLEQLQRINASRLGDRVAAAREAVKEARATKPAPDSELAKLADEVEEIGSELEAVVADASSVNAETERAREDATIFRRERVMVEKQFEIGAGRGAFAQLMLQQLGEIPDLHALKRKLRDLQEEISEVRFAAFEVAEKLRRGSPPRNDADDGLKAQLAALRLELLSRLQEEYQRRISRLNAYYSAQSQVQEEALAYKAILEEALFWVPSSPRVGLQSIRELPEAASWLLGPQRWAELGGSLLRLVRGFPMLIGFAVLLVALSFLVRPRIRRIVASHRIEIQRISTDRIRFTFKALALVLLVPLPLPLLVSFVGFILELEAGGSEWLHGTGRLIRASALWIYALDLLRELCRRDGLGSVHFGWPESKCLHVRRVATRIVLGYLPAVWVILLALSEENGRLMHSAGRIALVASMLWIAWQLGHLLRGRNGLFGHGSGSPAQLGRWHKVAFFLAVGLPVGFALAALGGYVFTAMELGARFVRSLWILAFAYFLYSLVLRWFVIRERRAALYQARKARQARQARKEAASAKEDKATAEEGSIPEVEEESIDLAQIGVQTRRLLRVLLGAVAILGCWLAWADALPVLRYLDTDPVLGNATVADLLLGALIVVASILMARNLPGLLEVAMLRNVLTDAGGRYAFAALAQYALIAVGFLTTFEVLGLNWSQFGWMAAALGVGLGFGLQEIVANFVSGIILLFERPIRVGDVVTVGETTGVVSRIRIRATTITDWDRKEFVVPNKEFVTGRLLNWTLSNKINRIIIKVGVGYGSDTTRVQELLAEIAGEHPLIMEDPAPLVTFESFGESSLDFTVRCYLPDLDRRLATTHDLNTRIHQRFAEEGIEIPFPQRDLHIRSGGTE